MKLIENLEEKANIECLEDIIRSIDDPKPYAMKVAKELRKQSIGNKVVMDDAAACLEDDCREFKNIVKELRNIVRRMKKDRKRHLTALTFEVCCDGPLIETQERRTPAADPLIAPIWEVRIVCRNCGKTTRWCRSYSQALKVWNGKEQEVEYEEEV